MFAKKINTNRILAIDPGFERLGIAVVDWEGGKNVLVYSECFKTSKNLAFSERLVLIGSKIENIIKKWKPNSLAIETLFLNTNQKTVMHVSEARGVVLYECQKNGLQVFEYSPLQIKVAVTGYGRATKENIISMVPRLIALPKKLSSDDELDAIACGLTHFAHQKNY